MDTVNNGDGTFDLNLHPNPNVLIPGNYWLFALNANDTPSIGQTVQILHPFTNQAVSADGTQALDIPNISLDGDFTIEFWAYLEPGQAISNLDGIVGNSADGFDIQFYQSRARLFARDYGQLQIRANAPTVDGQWTHYAFVREGSTLTLYINGVQDAAVNDSFTAPFVIDYLLRSSATRGALYGQLDELRIWSLARSAADVAANHTLEIGPSTSGLLAYYKFDSGGDSIIDATGNAATATLPATGVTKITSTAPIITSSFDSDGDGVPDSDDAFPFDASETTDTDGDGVGDNSDPFPDDASETVDSDGDGVGDNADAFPNDASETTDTDGDGVGDNADAFPNDPTQ